MRETTETVRSPVRLWDVTLLARRRGTRGNVSKPAVAAEVTEDRARWGTKELGGGRTGTCASVDFVSNPTACPVRPHMVPLVPRHRTQGTGRFSIANFST